MVAKRNRFEGEIDKIKGEIAQLESEHQTKMEAIDRKLLEERVRYQKESERKLNATEMAANEVGRRMHGVSHPPRTP